MPSIPELNKICLGDTLFVLKTWPDSFVQCCVTSPPYWGLRDYGADGQLGLEKTPEEYVARMVAVFREVKRVLRDDGTLWLNMGDSYATSSPHGSGYGEISKTAGVGNSQRGVQARAGCPTGLKPKDLCGIPWMLAFALRADGWYLRSDIIWAKPNPMPESVTDRPTKSHEYMFLLSKSANYYFDQEAVREPHARLWDEKNGGSINTGRMVAAGGAMGDMSTHPKGYPLPNPSGRNLRSVWNIATQPFPEAHFATFPEKLVEPCVKAGTPTDGIVLDPFMGAGTVGLVATKLNRSFLGIELNPEYKKIAEKRIAPHLAQQKLF